MKIKLHTNANKLKSINKQIRQYETSFEKKCRQFLTMLIESGYIVALNNKDGTFGSYITIKKEYKDTSKGFQAIMIATDSGDITRYYLRKNDSGNEYVEEYDISPLLMIEFGSGLQAENPKNIPGVGTGSLDKYGHANQPDWYFKTLDGVWVKGTGYYPHQPMTKAFEEIQQNVSEIAREVFGNG